MLTIRVVKTGLLVAEATKHAKICGLLRDDNDNIV